MKTERKNAIYVIEQDTLHKSVKVHAGTARSQATEIETVLVLRMKEEGHRVETEIGRNLLQEQETNKTNQEESGISNNRY